MVIEVKKLVVKYPNFTLNIDKPITIKKGDRLAIMGHNGSGKTTFIKAILNSIKYHGEIERNVHFNDVGVLMQSNNFNELYTVKEILELILQRKIDGEIVEALKQSGIDKFLTTRFGGLSGGQKQKLFIFLIMYDKKKLYIFDEITTGLDYDTRKSTINLIKREVTEKDSLIIVSHYFEEVDNLANKILIIEGGKVIEYGYIDEIIKEHNIKYAYALKKQVEGYDGFEYEESYIVFLDDDEHRIELLKKCAENFVEYREIHSKSDIINMMLKMEVSDE